jgi:hypothetical protein
MTRPRIDGLDLFAGRDRVRTPVLAFKSGPPIAIDIDAQRDRTATRFPNNLGEARCLARRRVAEPRLLEIKTTCGNEVKMFDNAPPLDAVLRLTCI